MIFLLKAVAAYIVFMIVAALLRRFAPETLANGFMDEEKGREIAPTIFRKSASKDPKK